MAKSTKGKDKKDNTGTGSSWEDNVKQAVINDDEWKCHVILLAEGDYRFTEYLTMFHEAAKDGLRRCVKSISYQEEIKNTKIQGIRKVGAAKQKKQDIKVEQGSAKFLGDAGQALQDALKEVKNNPYLVPGDLLALYVKLLILTIKESDIEMSALQLELKQELEMENMMMLSAGKLKGKASGKNGGSEKGKGKGKEAKSPENMHINKLYKRGQEWQIKDFIEDQPEDGPQMYIALLGFLHSELPRHLLQFGVPLTAILKVTEKVQKKEVSSEPIGKSASFQQNGKELIGSFDELIPTAISSTCEWKDPEEFMLPSTEMFQLSGATDDSANSDITPFWEGLKLVEEEDPFCLKDVALVAFHVPDFPEASDGLQLAKQIMSEMIKDPDTVKEQKKNKQPKDKNNKTDEDDKERAKAVYELLSNILYCVENINHKHQKFLDQTETISLDCTPLFQEETAEENLQLYNKMISMVPPECITVPVILHCLLEQVDALCNPPEEFRTSISNEKRKSQTERKQSRKSQASPDLKHSFEVRKLTLTDIPETPKAPQSSPISSENRSSRLSSSQRQYQSSSSLADKGSIKISYALPEAQESEYLGEYHVLEPEEIKSPIKRSTQYQRLSSRNEYLLEEPNIILHGDEADLLTFHLEMPDLDFWSIIIQMLEKNPIALLWNNYPPLKPMQYIKSNYDFNRLWHAMGGSPKCSRSLLRNYLSLATFELLYNVEDQPCTDSPEPEEKQINNFKSEKKSIVDASNIAIKTVSCINQEDASSEYKLQYPYPLLCSIYLTPFRMEDTDETANDLNRSSLREVDLKMEKIATPTKTINERAHSLSEVHEMLECPELMQLLESLKYSSEFREQDYPYITTTHRNLERLTKPVMLQTLQKYWETFKNLKYRFSPLMDELLLFFHHGDKCGTCKEKWCAAIESPVALRDFYEYILYPKARDSSQREITEYLLKEAEKEAMRVSIKESVVEPRFTDEDFILESSIKYKVNAEKKAELEQQATSEDKLKGKKDKASPKPEDDQKGKSDEKGVKKPSSEELALQEGSQTFEKKEFQYQIYDLGPLRMQYSGSSNVYLSSDHCHIRVDISQWLYGTPQIYSQFYKHGHILSLYTYFKPSIGPFIKEPLMFNIITAKGALLTFTKCSYKPSPEKTSRTPSVSSENKIPETEKLNNKAAKVKVKESPSKANNKKNVKENGDMKKPEKESLDDMDPKDTVADIPYYSLKITWPNSLLIETVMKVQNDEEQSEKLCTIVPISIDQLYIRQRYYDKGPECSSIHYESYRCVLCNGNVLKFMTDDTLEVLTAYGTIYYINTILKPESSTSLNNIDRRSSKLGKRESETLKNAAESKSRQKQQKASKTFSVHDAFETDRLTLSDHKIHLWQIKQYDVLNPDGVLFTIDKEAGTVNIIQRMLYDRNRDYRTGEILTVRGDGTSMLLLPGGNLVTTYPDNTTVCTVLHESIFEWTPEEREELRIAEWKIKLQMYQSMAEHGEMSLSSYEAFQQINQEMNRAMEESNGEGSSSSAYFEQDACPILEEFVMVNTTILVEHPNYATVTYEEVEKDVVISNPHGLEVKIIKKDLYSVQLDSTTSVTIKPDIIQYQASDRNSNMTSFTEVNLNILREEKEEKENVASKEENGSFEAKRNSVSVEDKNSEEYEEDNADLRRERALSILSCTTDAKGNRTLVRCNGEIEKLQTIKLLKKTSFGLQQLNNSLAHGRCIILKRDLSGFQMIDDKEKSAQMELFKTMNDVCMDKDPVIGSINLYSYTTIAPVYNTASQEWLMSSSELIRNVKITFQYLRQYIPVRVLSLANFITALQKKDLIPSTYGPAKSWIHPFNLNSQKLQKLEETFGTGDPVKQKKPLAVTLRIFQEIFSIGTNIANELKEGLSRYKSMAQDMYASYLSHEYVPDEEEDEIMQTIDHIADSPENIIRKYRIALLEKAMLKQMAEHDYHKQTRHPSICMRKLIEEAQQADYYKDLIRNYPKHVPPYFDSVPGMCFKMVLQSTDRALEKVEENPEEEFSKPLIPSENVASSSGERRCKCIGRVMERTFKKLLPKSTPSKEAWEMVLQSMNEETTMEPRITLEKAAEDAGT